MNSIPFFFKNTTNKNKLSFCLTRKQKDNLRIFLIKSNVQSIYLQESLVCPTMIPPDSNEISILSSINSLLINAIGKS